MACLEQHKLSNGYRNMLLGALDAISALLRQEEISQDTKDRILHHNPKNLYNL